MLDKNVLNNLVGQNHAESTRSVAESVVRKNHLEAGGFQTSEMDDRNFVVRALSRRIMDPINQRRVYVSPTAQGGQVMYDRAGNMLAAESPGLETRNFQLAQEHHSKAIRRGERHRPFFSDIIGDVVGNAPARAKDWLGDKLSHTAEYQAASAYHSINEEILQNEQITEKNKESTFENNPVQGFREKDMVWREGDRLPFVRFNGEEKTIDQFTIEDFPETNERITSFEIVEPGNNGQGVVHRITDPEQLEIANTIKRVADAVAPQWTDYLLRLSNFEGLLRQGTRMYMSNDTDANGRPVKFSRDPKELEAYGGVWSADRGPFQINDHWFPAVSEEMADDPVRATLFVISAIQAGHQNKWLADGRVRSAKTRNFEYEN